MDRCERAVTRDVIRCGAVRNVKRESFEVRRKGRRYWSDRYLFHDDIPLLTGPTKLLYLFALLSFPPIRNYANARIARCVFRDHHRVCPACSGRATILPRLDQPVLGRGNAKGTAAEGGDGRGEGNLYHLITLVGERYKLAAE